MAKPITITEEVLNQLREEFENKLKNLKCSDGKFKFEKKLDNINKKAELVFDEEVWLKMNMLISANDKEVGWHFLARRNEPKEGYDASYFLYGIEVYPQQVTGTTVNTDKAEYESWLYDHNDEDFSHLRAHGHSHVNMGTSPSSVDTKMYEDFLGDLSEDDFYVFSIWNKKGDHWVNIYDLKENIMFENKDVDVIYQYTEGGALDFVSKSKDMVKAVTYTAPKTSYSPTPGVTYIGCDGWPINSSKSDDSEELQKPKMPPASKTTYPNWDDDDGYDYSYPYHKKGSYYPYY